MVSTITDFSSIPPATARAAFAGRGAIGATSKAPAWESGRAPSFELYGLGLQHKHLPEIELYSGLSAKPVFVPSVGNFRQGMIVSVPLQLDALPGVGPVTAAAIVAWRDANGKFASVDQLGEVDGIGTARLEKLRALVRV